MPNNKSKIKRVRKSAEQRMRNRNVKSSFKTKIKRFEAAVAAGDEDAIQESFRDASRELDKAVSKGVIHKNKAANRKSRMAKSLGTRDAKA